MRMLPGTVAARPRMGQRVRQAVGDQFNRAKALAEKHPVPLAGGLAALAGFGLASLMPNNDSPDVAQGPLVTPTTSVPTATQQSPQPQTQSGASQPLSKAVSQVPGGYTIGALSPDDLRKKEEQARTNAALNAFYALKLREESDLQQNGV
jgi:hypothetical protein